MTRYLPGSLTHALILAGCMCAAAQAAPPATTTVYPTGTFPLDVRNVQAAIDQGGTVILKATNTDGIDIAGLSNPSATQRALVLGNHITTHSFTTFNGVIVFEGAVQNSLMAANVIDGTTGNAVQILGLSSTLVADSNLAVGNDMSHATSLARDVFFGPNSTNNLFAGQCNTYVDQGTGNRIECGHALSAAPAL